MKTIEITTSHLRAKAIQLFFEQPYKSLTLDRVEFKVGFANVFIKTSPGYEELDPLHTYQAGQGSMALEYKMGNQNSKVLSHSFDFPNIPGPEPSPAHEAKTPNVAFSAIGITLAALLYAIIHFFNN